AVTGTRSCKRPCGNQKPHCAVSVDDPRTRRKDSETSRVPHGKASNKTPHSDLYAVCRHRRIPGGSLKAAVRTHRNGARFDWKRSQGGPKVRPEIQQGECTGSGAS